MFQNVVTFLESIPIDCSLDEWYILCEEVWKQNKSLLSHHEYKRGMNILSSLLQLHRDLQSGKHPLAISQGDKQPILDRILATPQIEQRTDDWYKEYQQILSGSQYATLFKGPRTRGQLILEKAGLSPKQQGDRPLATPSEYMNAFSWGIRFEPVIQQIYMDLTKTRLKELGRIKHQTNPRLGASPDGFVIEDFTESKERLARFVEFKAPVSRAIYNKVPEDYMIQMQIQMEVGDIAECDYLEVQFQSVYKSQIYEPPVETPKYSGIIYLLQNDDVYRYMYSPLHAPASWEPSLEEGDVVCERIPWHTNEWFLTTVKRDIVWYETIGKPAEEAFWADVEAAKRGEWTLPEASRVRTKKEKYTFIDTE